MRGLSWTFAGLVGLTLVLVALAVLGIWQPDITGRWCPEGSHWLVCYRDWLVPLSGWAVAVAAAGFIAHERIKARQTKEQIVRAARLRIGLQLQELITACNKVVSEIDLFQTTAGQRGKPHMSIPQPRFVEETAELSFLPAQEADATAWLAQEVFSRDWRQPILCRHRSGGSQGAAAFSAACCRCPLRVRSGLSSQRHSMAALPRKPTSQRLGRQGRPCIDPHYPDEPLSCCSPWPIQI